MPQPRMIFVNVPVSHLQASIEFFRALDFEFDPRFTDETAACMVVSDQAFVMLLTREKFAEFTKKPVADAAAATETILAVSADSREGVNAFADAALTAGATTANDPLDYGFMYSRAFEDPDGHIWEPFWMDMAGFQAAGAAEAAA